MSFEAKLKRDFAVATLTTEQLRDTNIYAEKPHTQMHMYWVTWFHKKKKVTLTWKSKIHVHIHVCHFRNVLAQERKDSCFCRVGRELMQKHTHIQMVAAGQTP